MNNRTQHIARSQILSDKLYRYINGIGEFRPKNTPSPRPFRQILMEFVNILPLDKLKTLRNGGGLIFDKNYEEWSRENPPKGEEIKASYLYLLWIAMLDADKRFGKEGFSASAKVGMRFGASLMHFVVEHPNSIIVAKLDELIGKDVSKEAERGLERVFRKRDKKRQDGRKSSVEAKRKTAAIAMMKKLVLEHGQVEASEMVERRANKNHYDSGGKIEKVLPVRPGTIRRWYNAMLVEENRARKGDAEARLGRYPS